MHSIPPSVQSVCLSVRPSMCTSIYPFVCLSVQPVCTSSWYVCLSIRPPVGPSSPYVCPFRWSVGRSVYSVTLICPIVCLLIHHLSFCPFRVAPFHASICLSVHPVHPSVLPVGKSVCWSIHSCPSLHLSVHPSVCPSSLFFRPFRRLVASLCPSSPFVSLFCFSIHSSYPVRPSVLPVCPCFCTSFQSVSPSGQP